MPEISNDKKIITSLSGNIELSHVSFRYSDEMPERGAIFFDQKDSSRVDLKSLRRQMGVVLQDS